MFPCTTFSSLPAAQVVNYGSGDGVMVVTGSSLGFVTVTRLLIPRMPGTTCEDMQVGA